MLARLLPINVLNLFSSDGWRPPPKCSVPGGYCRGEGGQLIQDATVVVPVFRSRIAPVFDTCAKALFIAIRHGHEIDRSELPLRAFSSFERLALLQRAGATDLICGGISEVLHNMLETSGVRVIPGIAGEVEEVLGAFLANRLSESKFRMPGYGIPR